MVPVGILADHIRPVEDSLAGDSLEHMIAHPQEDSLKDNPLQALSLHTPVPYSV